MWWGWLQRRANGNRRRTIRDNLGKSVDWLLRGEEKKQPKWRKGDNFSWTLASRPAASTEVQRKIGPKREWKARGPVAPTYRNPQRNRLYELEALVPGKRPLKSLLKIQAAAC
jgi:hypothetical protein